MSFRSIKLIILCSLLLGLTSCDPIGKTYPVKGKVFWEDGEALKFGSVTFWPDTSQGKAPAFEAAGRIREDGTYELFTRGKPGALPGHYKVTITANEKAESTKPKEAVNLVHTSYMKKEITPLKAEVIVEVPAPDRYDFKLKK